MNDRLLAMTALGWALLGCAADDCGIAVYPVSTESVAAGKQLLREYGCTSCHTIPRVDGAHALVGPSLDRIGSRSYVGGVLPNSPDNMVRWIMDPPAIDPLTAMPRVGVNEPDARHIAAFLSTLR